MIWLTWAWSLLKRAFALARLVPWQVYAGLALVVAFWLHGNAEFRRGIREADERHRIADEAAREEQAAQAAKVAEKQAEVTTKVVTEYVDRVKVVRERAREVVKEVPIYVPADSCPLPSGFRVLHDAAAGLPPIPNPSARTDAAPVPAQAVAATVADNYGACRETAEQLRGLQAWVAQQRSASQ